METYNPIALRGKTIVITGASSGIGRQCAIACGNLGAKVILMGRSAERLGESQSQLNGADHVRIAVDLNEFRAVETEIKEKISVIGPVHGIVHCAGISTTLPLRMISQEHFDNFFQTNVSAAIHLTKLIAKPSIMHEGGSIIFVASVMGVVGEAGKTLYSLTKGALVAGTRSLAIELAPKKIRVNCISPGVVVTPMSTKAVYSQDETSLERIKSYHPLGLGTVEDVANACTFLLSDASRWITGTNLMVDGGYTAR